MDNTTPNTDFKLIARDLSWLSFNYRVLQEAEDPNVPLLERLKFLGIYSSNLDEFFRVRVATLRSLIRLGDKTKKELSDDPELLHKAVMKQVTQQQERFAEVFNKKIKPELAKAGISLINEEDLNKEQSEFVNQYFLERVSQYVQPVLLSKQKIRPFLVNGALYLAVHLSAKGGGDRYAVVRIPSSDTSRFVVVPPKSKKTKEVLMLDDVVRHYLPSLFPSFEIKGAYSFKFTRDAELHIQDEFSGNLIEKIKNSLAKRNAGPTTRFIYDKSMPKKLLKELTRIFTLEAEDMVLEGRYHNNADLLKFPDFGMMNLRDHPLPPVNHPELPMGRNVLEACSKQDLLLCYPYQSYEPVIRFFEDAATDPKVKKIKITQYRVAKTSRIMEALKLAVRSGKEVTAFVEIKARFDEEANIRWAEDLERHGVKVVYSLPGLKVHSKVAIVTREENGENKHYGYFSTGNFNESTAKIYSDFGLLTSDQRLCMEGLQIFKFLVKNAQPEKPYEHLLVGQFNLFNDLCSLVDFETAQAKQGLPSCITLKMNNLEEPEMIRKLYAAADAGVKVKLMIRGICCAVPRPNLEAYSLVDRFLEHARVFVFHHGGAEKIYLSSADWMTRNMHHRVECAFPVYDPALRQQLRDYLSGQFKGNVKVRILDEQLSNAYRRDPNEEPWRAQQELYNYFEHIAGKQ